MFPAYLSKEKSDIAPNNSNNNVYPYLVKLVRLGRVQMVNGTLFSSDSEGTPVNSETIIPTKYEDIFTVV